MFDLSNFPHISIILTDSSQSIILTHTHTHTHTHTYTCIYIYIHMYSYIYVHIYTLLLSLSLYIYIYIYMCVCVYIGCLNIHGTYETANHSTNNNVFFFVSDLKIVYNNNCEFSICLGQERKNILRHYFFGDKIIPNCLKKSLIW